MTPHDTDQPTQTEPTGTETSPAPRTRWPGWPATATAALVLAAAAAGWTAGHASHQQHTTLPTPAATTTTPDTDWDGPLMDGRIRAAAEVPATTTDDSRCGGVVIDHDSLTRLRDKLPGLTWDPADEDPESCALYAWRLDNPTELTGGAVYRIEASAGRLTAWEATLTTTYQE